MNIIIRVMVLGFITIGIASYFVGEQADQQASVHKNFQNQIKQARFESEQKNCQQFINAKFCTSPRNQYDRLVCSQRLAENHCGKYVDVGYLISDEHKQEQIQKDINRNYPG